MVPEETTTGAIRLVDTGGAVVWIQIPMKSMLMNQKEHHRLVDGCQEDEQRIAVQASQKAGANAGALAPSVASPAAVAAANGVAATRSPRRRRGTTDGAAAQTAAPGSTITTTSHHHHHHPGRAAGADEERCHGAVDRRFGHVEVSIAARAR